MAVVRLSWCIVVVCADDENNEEAIFVSLTVFGLSGIENGKRDHGEFNLSSN